MSKCRCRGRLSVRFSLDTSENSSWADAAQYFWQPRQWYEIFADDMEIDEGAKNEEVICQCGQKGLI